MKKSKKRNSMTKKRNKKLSMTKKRKSKKRKSKKQDGVNKEGEYLSSPIMMKDERKEGERKEGESFIDKKRNKPEECSICMNIINYFESTRLICCGCLLCNECFKKIACSKLKCKDKECKNTCPLCREPILHYNNVKYYTSLQEKIVENKAWAAYLYSQILLSEDDIVKDAWKVYKEKNKTEEQKEKVGYKYLLLAAYIADKEKQNYPEIFYTTGIYLYDSNIDKSKGIEYLNKALDMGYYRAGLVLAKYVPDKKEQYLIVSAEYCQDAQLQLAFMYSEKNDTENMMKYLKLSADQGNEDAIIIIAQEFLRLVIENKQEYLYEAIIRVNKAISILTEIKKKNKEENDQLQIFYSFIEFSKTVCGNCGKKDSEKDLLTCSRCTIIKYCNTECQTEHWKKKHKKDCKKK